MARRELRKAVYVKGRKRFVTVKGRPRCGGKMIFEKYEAMDAAIRVGMKRDVLLRAYACKRGNHWHLTSQV